MGLVAGGGTGVLRRARNEKEERQHAGAKDGEVLDDVEVAEHGGLAMKLVVDVGLGGVGTSSDHRVAAGVTTKHTLQFCDLIHEGGIAGGEVAHHVVLVCCGAAGEHGRHEGGSAGAADVTGEVGQTGDVVVL